jgi:hypothetical protein
LSSERLNRGFFGQVSLVSFDGSPPRDIGVPDVAVRGGSGAADPTGGSVAPNRRPGFASDFGITPPDRDVTPIAVSAGYLSYLASAGLIATAIIGIFFGAGFFSLASFQSGAIYSSGAENPVPAPQPVTVDLSPSRDSDDESPKDRPGPVVTTTGVVPSTGSDPSSVAILSSPSAKDETAPRDDKGAPQNLVAMPVDVEALGGARSDTLSHREVKGEGQLEKESGSGPAQSVAASLPLPGPAAGAVSLKPPHFHLSAAEISELLTQGDARLQIGDVTSARLFYERAADAGDGRGAMRLGATFDPAFLQRAGLRNIRGDAVEAQFWYSRALDPDSARVRDSSEASR